RNYGLISGAAAGIVVNNDSNPDNTRGGTAALDLVNYAGATIVGNNSYAIRSENKTGTAADNDRIVNYGTIIGNSGRAISMEGGDDTLNLYGGSSIVGRIDGGVGTDTINLFGPGSGTLSNVINFEVLNVQGGVWTITDAQSYQNGATVGSGATLLVNGSLGNAVTVNAGGTLGGNGSVGNLLING
ncbi:hypothetical protein CJI59_38070, partial [Streptomyces sp. Alain-F2R5]